MTKLWTAIKPLAMLAAVMVILLSLSRAVLTTIWWSRVVESDAAFFIATQGLRFDLVITGVALVWPLLLLPLLVSSYTGLKIWSLVLSLYIPLVVMVVLLMELATPSFVAQFDARPNILFIEYLAYPKDIFVTLWVAYKPHLLIAIPLILIAGYATYRYVRRSLATATPVHLGIAVPSTIVLLLICGLCIRSSMGTKPVSPASIAKTTDGLLNELPLSSPYTVLYAAYELKNEDTGRSPYSSMDAQTALDIVRREMHVAPELFSSSMGGTWHSTPLRTTAAKPKNLVIILEENLGVDYVGSMSGPNITPNIDALREQGWSLDQLYATGSRSNRGLEAVITGFPPTSSRSTIKLTKSQREFYTIARSLKKAGYDTSFIYGGQASFDNRSRFFTNNGFDLIVEQRDYSDPAFTGTWGVSDEDVFERAHEEFSKPREQPFFSLIFTTSSHIPFEYPDGRITPHEPEKNTIYNAVKYADYALGQFIANAKQSDYWDDTVFLIVADHDAKMYGTDLVPIKRFHIPGIIIGQDIEPRHDTRIASQIDLAPTLLSLVGVSDIHPMTGRDLTALPDNVPGRAIMQYYGIQAYMEEDEVVVLQKELKPKSFRYNGTNLVKVDEPSESLIEKAVAHAAWATDTYQAGEYKVLNYQELQQRKEQQQQSSEKQ